MKITISTEKKKRSIDGDFSICLSHEDLKTLVDILSNKLQLGHSFGWIDIRDRLSVPTNTEPTPWDEP